ncbi:Protein CHLOROPLAST J-LIKE DOMAIN 1, chloroplastic [Linum grandiflorum]
MAFAISNAFTCPKPRIPLCNWNIRTPAPRLQPSFVRFSSRVPLNRKFVCLAASAAGSSSPDNDLNPYEILGVNPFSGFEAVKKAHKKKRQEAESMGDETAVAQLDKAYDNLMMAQLKNRKQGVTYGSFKVSKDVKYADKQPMLPWGPRFTKSGQNDMRINLAISAVFVSIDPLSCSHTILLLQTAWILIKRSAEYKPLQFLAFAFVYRLFEKLKATEPAVSPTVTEDGEDDGRGLRMGKRILRSLALSFGCIAFVSLAYTGILNVMEYTRGFIPMVLYNNQEPIITASSAICLYILASYYR